MQIKSAKDLIVYQKAYALAMEIFEASKKFPAEEKYSLIDYYLFRRPTSDLWSPISDISVFRPSEQCLTFS